MTADATDPLVTMRHWRQYGGCGDIGKWRAGFEALGLNIRAFRRGGLPASVLEATGHEIARGVAAMARAEAEGGR